MLTVIGGLPGTGKTTIAKLLAGRLSATYLRVDEIEHAIRSAPGFQGNLGPAGYIVANALARSNLAVGQHVVADCVNPVRESREGWRRTALQAAAPFLEVEVICSNPEEHRRRVESRHPDIEGFALPTWASVQAHQYEPWPEPHLVVDTAFLALDEVIAAIEQHIGTHS